jgi:hypothetical protein
MSARDKIAKLMWPAMLYASKADGAGPAWVDGGNSLAQVEARQAADAILAALPDMIAPMVWEGNIADNGMGGRYCVSWYGKGKLGASLLFFRYGNPDVQEHIAGYSSFEDMVTAANAHNRAAIMAAFNGEAKP